MKKNITADATPRNGSAQNSAEGKTALIARGRLAEAKQWFTHCGWDALPQSERGRRILSWGADQAYLASAANQTQSVRRWCRRWAPWLTEAELAELVADTIDRNKRWSPDQCAAVLEIGVSDRETHHFRFIGADDDPNYKRRLALGREKSAASSRKYRAAHSTGAKRGRPALQLSEAERSEHTKAQGAKRAKKKRARSKSGLPRGRPKSGMPVWQAAGASSKSVYYRNLKTREMAPVSASGTENASRKNASCHISNIRSRDGI